MTPTVKEQILKVRSTAEANMFDINAVMQTANRLGLYDLVVYLADDGNRKEYSRFILTGEA